MTPAQQAQAPTEPKAASSQAPKQPAATSTPPPPVESKPTAEEVKATAASLAGSASSAAAQEPTKAIPTGPKSSRSILIPPAVPLPAALTAKAAQQSQASPKPVAEQARAEAAAAALRDATQAAKAAVAVAMAKLDTSPPVPQAGANGVDNLSKKVDELRINAARAGHANRGGRGRGGPRLGKVEVPDTDFDFASANAKFNKHDVVKEAIAGTPFAEAANGDAAKLDTVTDVSAPVEPAYNRAKSFFDNISSETKDRESAGHKPGGREWRGEEQRKNIETFGQGSVDGGYRGYRGGRGRGRGGRGRGYRGGRGGSGGLRQREAQPAAQ